MTDDGEHAGWCSGLLARGVARDTRSSLASKRPELVAPHEANYQDDAKACWDPLAQRASSVRPLGLTGTDVPSDYLRVQRVARFVTGSLKLLPTIWPAALIARASLQHTP